MCERPKGAGIRGAICSGEEVFKPAGQLCPGPSPSKRWLARMQLYTRAASSCSFRIRIALGVKKLKWEPEYVDNAKQQGENYRELNPQGLVPLLVDGDAKIGQTLAIMEYFG